MRISQISINDLFGIFNHTIPFRTPERVTIIHGPNGVGKTTVLKLINDLFSLKFNSLRTTPYSMITIDFTSPNAQLIVERESGRRTKADINLKFTYKESGSKKETAIKHTTDLRRLSSRFPINAIEDIIDPLDQIGPEEWLDEATGDILNLDEVLQKYGDKLPFNIPLDYKSIQPWLKQLLESLQTHFIQTQRLFAEPVPTSYERHHRKLRSRSAVERCSADMTDQIQSSLRQSGIIATKLDRIFPHRLLDPASLTGISELRIRRKYEAQGTYRKRLMDADLIDAEEPLPLPESKLGASDRKVLWHYLNDVEEKFRVFDELLKRVELFKDIINTRFLFKTFSIDKNSGFVFTSQIGETVPLQKLSSGEQHELVLGYELIFRVKENSLILIDEPELSLHVRWQHKFLEDIERISALANLDFLVATHSPQIIHNRRDLMVRLG